MKVTFNKKKNHFILRCETKFPKETYEYFDFIEGLTQPKDNKIIIPHTETNTGILQTLSGFNWSTLAFDKLYDVPTVIEEPKTKGLNHDLFAFQEEGVQFLNANNGRGVICDENLLNTLTNPQKKNLQNVKNLLDFSLCPCYNIVYGFSKKQFLERENNAIRSIQENRRSKKTSAGEFSKGKDKESKEESNSKVKRDSKRPSLEKKSIREHKKSNALSRNKGETSKGIEEGETETWNQLQRGEWTRADTNSKTGRQAIITMWLHKGISDPDKTCSEQLSKCCECVQSRLWKSTGENSNRTRRSKTSKPQTTRTGSEENESIEGAWLECNTIKSLQSMITFKLNYPLFPFQFDDVQFLNSANGKALICSEMGLGKTVQSLAWSSLYNKRTLIICPASVKYNWEKEIKHWLKDNKNVFVLNGRKTEVIPENTNYMIVNYDIIAYRGDNIVDYDPEIVILDEFHYIKENKTKRTKAVKLICGGRDHIIGLSGTPIKSRPLEFFNMLNLVNPVMFPSWWQYAQKYCDAKHNRFGWNFKGASNIEELNLLLEGIMIRRLKKDVLKDLPDKIRSTVPIELTNRKEYDRAKKDFLAYTLQEHGLDKATSASNAEGVVKKGALRRLAIEGKMKGIVDWLQDFLDDNVDEKIIVFTIHKKTIQDLLGYFNEVAVVIEGDTPTDQRTEIVEEFQTNDEKRMFIGNMMSAGTGITLTASSTVCFLEIDYIPNEFLQAEDRAHRIGQKDSVNIYYFLGKNSIDEDIMIDILNPKMSIFNQIVDGKCKTDTNIFETLMEGREENE